MPIPKEKLSELLADAAKGQFKQSPLKTYLETVKTQVASGKSPIQGADQPMFIAAADRLLNTLEANKAKAKK